MIGGVMGLLGLVAGLVISRCAQEEVQKGERLLAWIQLFVFVLAAGVFLFGYGYLPLSVGLVLSLALWFAPLRIKSYAYPLVFGFFLVLSHSEVSRTLAGFFFVIGLLEGGLWKASHSWKGWPAQLSKDEWLYVLSAVLVMVVA